MNFEVSVIIPVYNAKKFLQKSIQSALDQEEVKEVLVIDDGSTDGSYELLKSWNEQEERIQLFTHIGRINLGPGISRNVGIENSVCEFMTFLDADDYYTAKRFQRTKKIFQQTKQVNAVYEPVIFHSDLLEYKDCYSGYLPQIDNTYYLSFNENSNQQPIERWWLDGGFYHISGLTIKNTLLDKIGKFDPNLFQAEDTDLHFRIALEGNPIYITDIITPVAVRNFHGDNLSLGKKGKKESLNKFYEKYIFLLELDIKKSAKRKYFSKLLLAKNIHPSMFKAYRYIQYAAIALRIFIYRPKIIFKLI